MDSPECGSRSQIKLKSIWPEAAISLEYGRIDYQYTRDAQCEATLCGVRKRFVEKFLGRRSAIWPGDVPASIVDARAFLGFPRLPIDRRALGAETVRTDAPPENVNDLDGTRASRKRGFEAFYRSPTGFAVAPL